MNKSPLESTPSHARYMDFIAPKKSTPAGVPTKKIAAAKAAAKPKAKSVQKPASKPTPKPVEKPVEKSPKKAEAPDAASYTLGGKSPFLTSVNVEKRPLSSSIPPKKNVYEPKVEKPVEQPKEPTKIIKKKEKKSSGILMFFIVILTIILGALAGAAAFFLLPK